MSLVIIYYSSFLCYLPFLGSDIILSTLFSCTLNSCSSFLVRYQVLLPYKTVLQDIVLCILIFMFLGSKMYG